MVSKIADKMFENIPANESLKPSQSEEECLEWLDTIIQNPANKINTNAVEIENNEQQNNKVDTIDFTKQCSF